MARSILDPNQKAEKIVVWDWEKHIEVAGKHGIFQYLYRYMTSLDKDEAPSEDIVSYMKRVNAMDVRRGILQEHIVDTLRNGLEEKKIDHMFFKGAVTKERYPDPYLRSMGDIDLLYRAEQHNLLQKTMNQLGFVMKAAGRVHDIYTSHGDIIVEAHRQLTSPHSPYHSFCEAIRDRAEKKSAREYEYAMTKEDEFLFNFIHLASHFKKGGVGIRFIIDIWIYKRLNLDWDYVNEKLASLNLLQFYHLIELLSEKWFGTEIIEDDLVSEIERYVFSGGVFGNPEHRNHFALRKGKMKYLFRVCFPNYAGMKSMFPWLKCRILLPLAWMVRFFESVRGRRNNIKVLMEPLKNNDVDAINQIKHFYKRCGLDDNN